ncbi:MAG: hypothetical protein ACR2QC_08120 [Gammaproteobacteria bacterium]
MSETVKRGILKKERGRLEKSVPNQTITSKEIMGIDQLETNMADRPPPEWLPANPYPEVVFTMTEDEYERLMPDPDVRTAISGYLMREGYRLALEDCVKAFTEHQYDNPGNTWNEIRIALLKASDRRHG